MSELKRYIWDGSYGMSEYEEGDYVKLSEHLDRVAKLKELLTEIAGVASHGVLIGYASEEEAMRQVRILAAPYWDKIECTRLQTEAAKP